MFYQQNKWIDFSDRYISKNITVGIKHKASDFCFSMKRVRVQTREPIESGKVCLFGNNDVNLHISQQMVIRRELISCGCFNDSPHTHTHT